MAKATINLLFEIEKSNAEKLDKIIELLDAKPAKTEAKAKPAKTEAKAKAQAQAGMTSREFNSLAEAHGKSWDDVSQYYYAAKAALCSEYFQNKNVLRGKAYANAAKALGWV